MSRVAKAPVTIPSNVEVSVNGQEVIVKSSKASLNKEFNASVLISKEESQLTFAVRNGAADGWSQAGTARALVNNMIKGLTEGFEKKLQLVGVGYRASVKGNIVHLTLGFSHPVEYKLPEGVTAESQSQTELVIKGVDKQLVGQVAADIRSYRLPEPYKGKGVRYANETVRRKEAKKK